MANPIKEFRRRRTAPSAKVRFKNGTFTSYSPSGLSLRDPLYDSLNRIEGEDPGFLWSPAMIDQEITNHLQDTTYTEYPPHRYGKIVLPRKASNKDIDRSEYNIMDRRFNEAKSVLKQPTFEEVLKDFINYQYNKWYNK